MSGRKSRRKGRAGEQEAARLLRETYPVAPIRRGWQARSGGDAPDILGTPYHVEVKVGKAPNIRAAVKQAEAATKGDPILVMSKRDREGWLVTMRYEDWHALVWSHPPPLDEEMFG